MAMKKNPNIIRVNDNIVVNNPEFFVRCGYPLSLDMVQEEILTNNINDIHVLLKSVGIDNPMSLGIGSPVDRLVEHITRELAYYKIRQKKFDKYNLYIENIHVEKIHENKIHI